MGGWATHHPEAAGGGAGRELLVHDRAQARLRLSELAPVAQRCEALARIEHGVDRGHAP
jgi:hypothetical protein